MFGADGPYPATAITATVSAHTRYVPWNKHANTVKQKQFLLCLYNGFSKQLHYDTDCTHFMAANMLRLEPSTFIFAQCGRAGRTVSECPVFQKFLFRITYFGQPVSFSYFCPHIYDTISGG